MAVDQFESLCLRARQAMTQGNPEGAKGLYEQALEEDPSAADVHYGLATACFILGDLDGAAYHFQETTRLDPLRASAYVNLGTVFIRLDQLDEAVKVLRRGIQLDSRRSEAYYNLGLAYRRLGQSEQAVQAYREAAHLNPRMADAHYNLANLLTDMGRYSQAITHYRSALEIHPGFEKARAGLEHSQQLLRQEAGAAPIRPRVDAFPPSADDTVHEHAADLNRALDPQADGQVLTTLHQATIVSENYSRELVKALEADVEPAIKDLSTVLLYPEKRGGELHEKLGKFEAAVEKINLMHQSIEHNMKKLRELTDRLHGPVAS